MLYIKDNAQMKFKELPMKSKYELQRCSMVFLKICDYAIV
jgi:hypothetical protein